MASQLLSGIPQAGRVAPAFAEGSLSAKLIRSENHVAELSKLGQMYVGLFSNVAKPLEQASKGFAQIR